MSRIPRLDDNLYDDDDGLSFYVRDPAEIPPRFRYRGSPSVAEYGYEAPRGYPSNDDYYGPQPSLPKRVYAKVDGALTGKNIGYTVGALILIFALVLVLWGVVNKRR